MNKRDFVSRLKKGRVVKTRYPNLNNEPREVKVIEVYIGEKVESRVGVVTEIDGEKKLLDSFWIELPQLSLSRRLKILANSLRKNP
jgi:hypothetical protein